MWSPVYRYYQIRKDSSFSEAIPLEKAVELFKCFSFLKQTGKVQFSNKKEEPFVAISLVHTFNGNWAIQDEATTFSQITMIDIVTLNFENNSAQSGKLEPSVEEYEVMMKSVAEQLDWQVILEVDNDENEEVLIF